MNRRGAAISYGLRPFRRWMLRGECDRVLVFGPMLAQ